MTGLEEVGTIATSKFITLLGSHEEFRELFVGDSAGSVIGFRNGRGCGQKAHQAIVLEADVFIEQISTVDTS